MFFVKQEGSIGLKYPKLSLVCRKLIAFPCVCVFLNVGMGTSTNSVGLEKKEKLAQEHSVIEKKESP